MSGIWWESYIIGALSKKKKTFSVKNRKINQSIYK